MIAKERKKKLHKYIVKSRPYSTIDDNPTSESSLAAEIEELRQLKKKIDKEEGETSIHR
jgi:hypothetical protein